MPARTISRRSVYDEGCNGRLEICEPRFRIAEPVELDAHPVHDAEVEAAHFSILIAGVEVVERATGFERAAKRSGQHDRQPEAVVHSAGPQVGEEHQAGVVEHGAVALRHRIQLGREVGELAEVEARDAFVVVG